MYKINAPHKHAVLIIGSIKFSTIISFVVPA
ncbi:MAG: hypothetical protein JWQ40_2240 [Segetibacter sp.]|jgi:hypothetical protein|nr:hypothetical protein [Segetibacter sp.]